MRMKKCPECGEKYQPTRYMQPCCRKAECEISFAIRHIEATQKRRRMIEEKAKIAERKTVKIKLENMRPLSYFADKAQKAVNAVVRERDKNEPCISCGRLHDGAYDAGHYRSRGAAPALRFNLDNIHKQCVPCNQHKSGNAIEYRIRLVKKIGIERVEWLEQEHPSPHWKREDYERIEAEHKKLLKEIRK